MLEEKLKAGIIIENTNQGTLQEGLIEKIISYIHSYDLDVLLGPEWLFLPKGQIYTSSEKEDIIARIAESTKERDTLIIPGSIMWEDNDFLYNTAPIISKGQLIGENHKFLDGGDSNKASERNCKKNLSNKKPEYLFKWKDYQIGVEICADRGTIKKILEESKKPLLDIYFLVACGMGLYEGETIYVKKDGYALYSDGSRPDCAAFKKISDGNNKMLKAQKVLNNLWLYILNSETIDDPKEDPLKLISNKMLHKEGP